MVPVAMSVEFPLPELGDQYDPTPIITDADARIAALPPDERSLRGDIEPEPVEAEMAEFEPIPEDIVYEEQPAVEKTVIEFGFGAQKRVFRDL